MREMSAWVNIVQWHIGRSWRLGLARLMDPGFLHNNCVPRAAHTAPCVLTRLRLRCRVTTEALTLNTVASLCHELLVSYKKENFIRNKHYCVEVLQGTNKKRVLDCIEPICFYAPWLLLRYS